LLLNEPFSRIGVDSELGEQRSEKVQAIGPESEILAKYPPSHRRVREGISFFSPRPRGGEGEGGFATVKTSIRPARENTLIAIILPPCLMDNAQANEMRVQPPSKPRSGDQGHAATRATCEARRAATPG
jgi:hypothetical protein